MIVLVIVFGALVAAGMPLILGLVSIAVALGLTALLGNVLELSMITTRPDRQIPERNRATTGRASRMFDRCWSARPALRASSTRMASASFI